MEEKKNRITSIQCTLRGAEEPLFYWECNENDDAIENRTGNWEIVTEKRPPDGKLAFRIVDLDNTEYNGESK